MKKVFSILAIALVTLASCGDLVEEIDWKEDSIPQKLVVEGRILNTMGNHPIKLTYSDNYFANTLPTGVKNAKVSVSVNKRTYNYIEDAGNPGTYLSETVFQGEPGNTYSLNIELEKAIDGERFYSANSTMANTMRIDAIQAELFENPYAEEQGANETLVVLVMGQEPANEDNFYFAQYKRNGKVLDDTVTMYTYFSDADMDANGKDYMILSETYEFAPGDTVSLELYSISEEYHRYIIACGNITVPADPFGFSGPPANAVSNINNGKGLGYFYASMVSEGETIVLDKRDDDR